MREDAELVERMDGQTDDQLGPKAAPGSELQPPRHDCVFSPTSEVQVDLTSTKHS